jgi:uncharacterized membrane protein YfcA
MRRSSTPPTIWSTLLALLLMTGGVIGAVRRAPVSGSGEQLRLLLGILVLSVGLRFAYDIVVRRRTSTMRVEEVQP